MDAQHEDSVPVATNDPVLALGPDAARALDEAIDMLGIALRLEAQERRNRRTALLRTQLSLADSRGRTLRDRLTATSDAD